MSLTGRNSDTHSHLARRVGKKHNSLHTVTPCKDPHAVPPCDEAKVSTASKQSTDSAASSRSEAGSA